MSAIFPTSGFVSTKNRILYCYGTISRRCSAKYFAASSMLEIIFTSSSFVFHCWIVNNLIVIASYRYTNLKACHCLLITKSIILKVCSWQNIYACVTEHISLDQSMYGWMHFSLTYWWAFELRWQTRNFVVKLYRCFQITFLQFSQLLNTCVLYDFETNLSLHRTNFST